MTIENILDDARDRRDASMAAFEAQPRTDYEAINVSFRKQKGALTRAINSKDPKKVQEAVVKAMREWRAAPWNGMWPDNWARWQVALDDSLGWNDRILLEDIR